MKTSTKKTIFIFYMIFIVGACLSFIFSNVSYDCEYQMAMAYRMIKGDRMILEMWEPHQTSAFLCTLFMKIYMMITGTTTGIVLYMQVVGLCIRGGIAALFYKEIKELCGKMPALIVGMTYLLISPKELLTPEFGNMQLWFGTLLFFAFLKYYKTEKKIFLVLGAVSLCLGVFSYPSFILVSIAVIIILVRFSKEWKKDLALFVGVCLLIGGSFVAYILCSVGWDTCIKCIEMALAVEPSHTVGPVEKIWGFVVNIGEIAGMLAAVGTIGLLIELVTAFICSLKNKAKLKLSGNRWFMISWLVLICFFLLNILSVSYRGGYAFPFILILGLGFIHRKRLSESEKRIYDTAFWISGFSLIATLILSDNAFLQAITYMLVLICVSMVPIFYWFRELSESKMLRRMFLTGMHIFFILILFRCIYIHIPMHGVSQIISPMQPMSIIRSGPAIGIITDSYAVTRNRDSLAEWAEIVEPGDKIWLVAEPVNTLGYLYEDVEVAAPTVMSTPTFNESLLYYWELNPDKYPEIIMVSSCYGELESKMQKNEWLITWLEEEYCADQVIDGHYWRYYIKKR